MFKDFETNSNQDNAENIETLHMNYERDMQYLHRLKNESNKIIKASNKRNTAWEQETKENIK